MRAFTPCANNGFLCLADQFVQTGDPRAEGTECRVEDGYALPEVVGTCTQDGEERVGARLPLVCG